MSIETQSSYASLRRWAGLGAHRVIVECRPNMYLNGLPEWLGQAIYEVDGWEVRIEAGPSPDVETLAGLLLDRLAMAGIEVSP